MASITKKIGSAELPAEMKRLNDDRQKKAPWNKEVSREISDRLTSTFTQDEHGRRPVYGGTEKFQTGWSGVVAKLIQFYGQVNAGEFLEVGKSVAFHKGATSAGKEMK